MATSNLTVLSRAPECGVCPHPKPASWCSGCPRELPRSKEDPFHFVDGRLSSPADVVVVAEAPVVPRIVDVTKLHTPFADDAGAIVTSALKQIQQESAEFANLTVAKTYSVLCTGVDPNKSTVDHCKGFLHDSLSGSCRGARTPVVIAMGMAAVRALGIQAKSQKEILGRIVPGVVIGDRTYTVVVTISTKQAVAASGLYTTFLGDIRRAFQLVTAGVPTQLSIEELTKDYRLPMTVAEARAVCEEIISYAEDGKDPASWSISVDTETNTLFPHRSTLKLLGVSFAWATGKATYIPLWHPETPYDPTLVVEAIRRVLECAKPKSFHNAKYDLKVFRRVGWTVNRFAWDTMLAEHALEEDKKGQYGLKQITRNVAPEFAGYADVLHEILAKQEGDSQLDNIRKAKKTKAQRDAEAALGGTKKKSKKQKADGGFEKIPLKQLALYGAVDTDMTRRISLNQLMRIHVEETRVQQLKKREFSRPYRKYPIPQLNKSTYPVKSIILGTAIPVVPVLAKIEYEGIRVDREYADELTAKLEVVVSESERELYQMSGKQDLKLNSAAAIANVLFSEGFVHPDTGQRTFYPPVSFTKHNQAQTTEKVLKYLVAAHRCPFSAKQLVYRKATKAKDTFLANVRDLSELDGFLHTNYNIHGTGTGRLSSNDENMQNIPKKLAGYSIKKIFIPDDDSYAFVNADAKGAEIRIFTAYTGDRELIQSLNEGLDTHSFIGAKIIAMVRLEPGADEVLKSMDLDPQRALSYEDFAARDAWKRKDPKYGEMLDKFRTAIKRVVFGILYGAGPRKIAETIGISFDQAKGIIELLFRLYPSIPTYIKKTEWELDTFGFVETYFGRRRRFSVQGAAGYLKSRARRQAVNFKIQSTSSDIVLGRLIAANDPLVRDLGGRLLLTVHDSIGFQVPKKYLSQLPDFVSEVLEKGAAQAHPWLPVAFKWDYEVGPSYGEMSPLKDYLANISTEELSNAVEEAYTEEEVRSELATGDAA